MANTFKSPLQKAVVTWLAAHPDVTVAELARRAEIDKSDLGKINAGAKASLNMESAGRLAKAMGTTVEGLLASEATSAPGPAPTDVRIDEQALAVGVRLIPLNIIDPSPDNPRKTFDPEALAELAASIAEQGLLQPIVVRPVGPRFEIVAGERRFRALGLNKAEAALCVVREGDDDGNTRALRIIENLQRADIKPLEEAEAFLALADLDPKKWNAATIGKAIGMSDRFVAQRLSIARNLEPGLKEQLKAGDLKVEYARVLAGWPQKMQARVHLDDWVDASNIRNQLKGMAIPASRAAFDLKLYTSEIVDHDGEKYLTDKEMFLRLQDEAAAALATSLAKKWPGARFVPKNPLTGAYVWADNGEPIHRWAENRNPKTRHDGLAPEDVMAFVWVDDSSHEIIAYKGVVLAETFEEKAAKSADEMAVMAEMAAAQRKAEQVDEAISAVRGRLLDEMPSHAQLAQALFIYAALGHLGRGGLYVDTDPKDYLAPWKAQLEGILEMDEYGWEPYDAPVEGEDKLWAWLITLGPEQIEQMFCRLMAVQIAPVRYRAPGEPQRFAFKALGLSIPDALQEIYDEDEERNAQLDADDQDLSDQLSAPGEEEADAEAEAA